LLLPPSFCWADALGTGLWLLLTVLTAVADILMTLVPTMGDTTSSAIVSALAISAVAIPLADSTVVDSMAVADSTAVADMAVDKLG
jgi:hypothetical protein